MRHLCQRLGREVTKTAANNQHSISSTQSSVCRVSNRTCSVVSSTRHWGARRVSRHRWNTDAASASLSLASGRRGLSLIGQNTNAASLPLARILTQPLSHWPAPTQPLSRWTAPTQPLSYWPAADAASLSLAKIPTRPLCHWPEYRRGHSFIGQNTDAASLSLARIPTRPRFHWPEYRRGLSLIGQNTDAISVIGQNTDGELEHPRTLHGCFDGLARTG